MTTGSPAFWTDPAAALDRELERDVKHQILERYGSHPRLRLWNHPTGVGLSMDGERVIRYGLVGSGDLNGILAARCPCGRGPYGRALWVETKSARGEQRRQQIAFEGMIRSHGGIYVMAHSYDEFAGAIEPYLADERNR